MAGEEGREKDRDRNKADEVTNSGIAISRLNFYSSVRSQMILLCLRSLLLAVSVVPVKRGGSPCSWACIYASHVFPQEVRDGLNLDELGDMLDYIPAHHPRYFDPVHFNSIQLIECLQPKLKANQNELRTDEEGSRRLLPDNVGVLSCLSGHGDFDMYDEVVSLTQTKRKRLTNTVSCRWRDWTDAHAISASNVFKATAQEQIRSTVAQPSEMIL